MVNAFYVLRQSLHNFKKFAEGISTGVEKGEEGAEKGSLLLPEMYGGGNSNFNTAATGKDKKG